MDAFRVKADYTVCTPNVAKQCDGAKTIWMDSCGMATGQVAESCDDGDACTIDACSGGTCTHSIAPECQCKANHAVACKDGKLTWFDSCGKPGAVKLACTDGDPCTIDVCNDATKGCEFPKSPAPACNCQPKAAKVCQGNGLVWIDSCGTQGAAAESCDDGDPCTIDSCDGGAQSCAHLPSPAPACQPCMPKAQQVCQAGNLVWLDTCGALGGVASSCDDGDDCTIDSCDPNGLSCVHAPSNASHCIECEPEAELVCKANNVWWLDSCGDADVMAESCDDQDPCTIDGCNADTLTCEHTPSLGGDCAACPAQVATACVEGQLLWMDGCGNVAGGVADACNDGDPCTADGCDAGALACTHAVKQTPECVICQPGAQISCVAGDIYSLDSCGQLEALVEACEDGDPCTLDSCDPETGQCMNLASDAPECFECQPFAATACSADQTSIVWVDGCGKQGEVVVDCDDEDPCTVDTCDTKTGFCVHLGSASDACDGVGAQCDGAESTVCMDGHIAWVDSCGTITGVAKACSDGDPCTIDSCDPQTITCTTTASLEDECSWAGPGDCAAVPEVICEGGSFYWIDGCGTVVGTAKICDDGDACTQDLCNPDTIQCDFEAVPPSKACPDSQPEIDGGQPGDPGDPGDPEDPETPEIQPEDEPRDRSRGDTARDQGMTIWGGGPSSGDRSGEEAEPTEGDEELPDPGAAGDGAAVRGCSAGGTPAPPTMLLLLAMLLGCLAVIRR